MMKKHRKPIAVVLSLLLAAVLPLLSVSATGASEDEETLSYRFNSNYAIAPEAYETNCWDDAFITFTSPEDLEIVSLSFTCSVYEEFERKPAKIYNYAPFTEDMICSVQESDEVSTVTGSISTDSTPYSVAKGEMLFFIELTPALKPLFYETDFCVTDLVVRTPDGDKTIVRNGYYIGYDEQPTDMSYTDEVGTNHCEDDVVNPYSCRSNYADTCGDGEMLYAESAWIWFAAPEDLEIVDFSFTLSTEYKNDPVYYEDITPFTEDMQLNYDGDTVISGSVNNFAKPYSLKKGERFLSFKAQPYNLGWFDFNFHVKSLTVKTATGYKTIISKGELVTDGLVIGDVNRNGVLDVDDATMLQRYLAQYTNADGSPIIDELADYSFYIANIHRDGVISIQDVTEIQTKLAEFEDGK